jgi:type IV secretory pathway TrbL component
METLIDTVVAGFLSAIEGALANVAPYGFGLLGVLAAIAFYFRYLPYVSSTGAGLGDALAGLILLMLGIGITMWMVLEIIPMGDALYQAAVTIGLNAAGSTVDASQLRNPSFILGMHKEVTRPLETFILNHTGFAAIRNLGPILSFWLAEMSIYVIFLGIAVHVAMIVIEFYFALVAATVLLPCVLFSPSTFLGEWAVGWVLGNTVRVMMVTLVVGIAVPLFELLIPPASTTDPRWVEVLGVVAAALLFGATAWAVPGKAANLVGHGLSLSASTVMGAASSSMRGVMVAQTAIRGASRLLQRHA